MTKRRRPDPWLSVWRPPQVKRLGAPGENWPPQQERLPHQREEIDAWAHELYRVDGIALSL